MTAATPKATVAAPVPQPR